VPRLTDRIATPIEERFDLTVADVRESLSERTVPAGALRFWYCFGGLAFFTAVLMALSGIFLAFYYQPTPDRAYASVFYLSTYVHYGWLIRSIHVWGARVLMGLVLVHMVRVYVTASYKHPREFNWVAGVLLFVVTLGFLVTGDPLPWDQGGFWSTRALFEIVKAVPVVGPALLTFFAGGTELGAAALTRFYAAHIMLLPAVMSVLLIAHFWMVRRQGISEPL
jgi:menaquinol-cytochrome c reductase cytochrome b subunit